MFQVLNKCRLAEIIGQDKGLLNARGKYNELDNGEQPFFFFFFSGFILKFGKMMQLQKMEKIGVLDKDSLFAWLEFYCRGGKFWCWMRLQLQWTRQQII